MEVAQNAKLMEQKNSFDKAFEIIEFWAVNDTYVIAGNSGHSIFVYNIKTPQTEKVSNISADEKKAIVDYVQSNQTTEIEKLEKMALAKIFNSTFYKVKITTHYDEHSSTYNEVFVSRLKDDYQIVKEVNDFIPLLKSNFKLNATTAPIFKEFLELFYPLGAFDDFVSHYKLDNNWAFTRSKSFGEIEGYVVKCDKKGKVISITKESNIKPKKK